MSLPDPLPLKASAATIFQRPWRLAILFIGIVLPLALCARLADRVWDRTELRFDGPILLALHRHATPLLDRLAVAVTHSGSFLTNMFFTAMLAMSLWRAGRHRAGIFMAVACGGAVVLDVIAKTFFRRDRPHLWKSIAPEPDYSFPSGHSMLSMSLAVALILLAWPTKWRWPVAIVGVLYTFSVGLSRLYLGVHFPSDVIGGWCAGLAWTIGVYFIARGDRDFFFRKLPPPTL